MASIQHLTSPITGRVAYRVQVRLQGHPAQSGTFLNRKDAERWASFVESAILEGRHFPHTCSQRISFVSLAQRYRENILADASLSRKANTERHIEWWVARLGHLSLAAITPDCIAEARDALALQPFSRGRIRKSGGGRGILPPTYKRSGATVNRYLATLSHIFATAVMQWRLIDKNPVHDVSKEKEARGRIRFLSDDERDACWRPVLSPPWQPLHALVLLAISTGARRGELIRLRWVDLAINEPSPQAIIQQTKNGDPRRLPLVGKALDAIRELDVSNAGNSELVFPSKLDPGRAYEAFDEHWYTAPREPG